MWLQVMSKVRYQASLPGEKHEPGRRAEDVTGARGGRGVLHDGGVGEERQPSVVARAAVGLATAFVCGAYRHPEAAILNNEIRSGRTTRRHDEEPA